MINRTPRGRGGSTAGYVIKRGDQARKEESGKRKLTGKLLLSLAYASISSCTLSANRFPIDSPTTTPGPRAEWNEFGGL